MVNFAVIEMSEKLLSQRESVIPLLKPWDSGETVRLDRYVNLKWWITHHTHTFMITYFRWVNVWQKAFTSILSHGNSTFTRSVFETDTYLLGSPLVLVHKRLVQRQPQFRYRQFGNSHVGNTFVANLKMILVWNNCIL